MLSNIDDNIAEILKDLTLENFKDNEMNWAFKILIAQNGDYEEKIKIAFDKQKSDMKDKSIFDILSDVQGIPQIEILKAYQLIAERLIELDNSLEDKILLSYKSTEVDILNGNFCIEQDKNNIVRPMYLLREKYLYKDYSYPIVLGTKQSIEDLKVKLNRFQDDIDNNFTFIDIVKDAISKDTSDIHIKYGRYYTVHFRIDGELILQNQYTMSKDRYDELVNEIANKASKDTAIGFNANDKELPQQGIHKYDELNVDLRIQFTPEGRQNNNILIVTRILKRGGTTGDLDSLQGYDKEFIEMLKLQTYNTSGLMLVAGVTNSGKSFLTSHFLMSIPDGKSITTAEDPIEYEKPRMDLTQHQTYIVEKNGQIMAKVGFLELLKAWKRADPDVTEVGEMREQQELVDSIVSSVKAGNFVVSTVHINSVYDVPNALVTTFGMDKYAVSSILRLLINQVLVQKLCPHCKLEDTNNQNLQNIKKFYDMGDIRYSYTKPLDDFLAKKPLTYIRNPKGCIECDYKGVKGVIPIYEFLKFDVETSKFFSGDFLSKNRFEIEEHFCTKAVEENKPYLATNKLTTYIKALENGLVDAHLNVATKVLL